MSSSPLKERLRGLIEASGPISVADYMATCLADPQHGYYMRRDPFGSAGDFVTAPEISQMFGELIGAWCLDVWTGLGRPEKIRLVELGPGRGTLMADMQRVMRLDPDFSAAASAHLVETSPVLREVQRATLEAAPLAPSWHTSLAEVPEGPLIVVANEFFDALPVHQHVLTEDAWRERVVGLDDHGTLAFGIGPGRLDPQALPPPLAAPRSYGVTTGAILETAPLANAIAAELGSRIATNGGAALIVDYGYGRTGIGDTLQALRRHKPTDPLAEPGLADLTAHVNFETLARAAVEGGACAHGPMTQGDFLVALGLLERAGRLGAGREEAVQNQLRNDVERLAGPDQMGTLFKVLALSAGCPVPRPFQI